MLCSQLCHGASFPIWYETAQPCLCGKEVAAAANELSAGRAAAVADRRQRPGQQLDPNVMDRTRIGLLHAHLAVPVASVPRLLVEPAAASVNSMAALLREFISIPSVRLLYFTN